MATVKKLSELDGAFSQHPPPPCLHCKKPARLVPASTVYGNRWKGMVWYCEPCRAWCGCHKRSDHKPLGFPANNETRQARRAAHSAFDPLWQEKSARTRENKGRARRRVYQWLADQLDIPVERCHIGEFDKETCDRVVVICQHYPTDTEMKK